MAIRSNVDDRLAQLRSGEAESSYVDFLVATSRRTIEDLGEASRVIDQPAVPTPLESAYISNVPGIALPNGQWLFYCRAAPLVLAEWLQLRPEDYVAASWNELFESDYEYWSLVFDADVERPAVGGGTIRMRVKFAELQPGEEPITTFVPGVFAGDEVPDLVLAERQRAAHVPRFTGDPDLRREPPAPGDMYFLVDGFGVDIENLPFIELSEDVTWWPATSFPAADTVLRHLQDPTDLVGGQRGFTGVFVVNSKMRPPIDHKVMQREFQLARVRIRRMRTALASLFNIRVTLVAEAAYYAANSLNRANGASQSYRMPSATHYVRRARFPADVLQEAAQISLSSAKKRSLLRFIQRALDSADLARSVSDLPVAHVLTWSAIEALISPSDKSELIANMTLALMCLNAPTISRAEFWNQAKESYQIRSTIVHAFDFPEPADLEKAVRFADDQFVRAMRHAVRTAFPNQLSREMMVAELREYSLAGVELA